MEMIIEVRSVNTLHLIDTITTKRHKKYEKICMKLTKMVEKNMKKNDRTDLLVRIKGHSYLVKSGNYGFVIGIKEPKSRWL